MKECVAEQRPSRDLPRQAFACRASLNKCSYIIDSVREATELDMDTFSVAMCRES